MIFLRNGRNIEHNRSEIPIDSEAILATLDGEIFRIQQVLALFEYALRPFCHSLACVIRAGARSRVEPSQPLFYAYFKTFLSDETGDGQRFFSDLVGVLGHPQPSRIR